MTDFLRQGPPRPEKLRGLEVLFRASPPKTPSDSLMLMIHWRLITDGFYCVGLNRGGRIPDIGEYTQYTELLPSEWNKSEALYGIVYLSPKEELLGLKAVLTEDVFCISFLNHKTNDVLSTSFSIENSILPDFESFHGAYNDRESLLQQIESDIVRNLNPVDKETAINLKEIKSALDIGCEDVARDRTTQPNRSSGFMPVGGFDPLRVGNRLPVRFDPLGPPVPDDMFDFQSSRNPHPDLPPRPDFDSPMYM